jgi:hypothetical protein
MNTIARQHPWKHQLRLILTVSILLTLFALAVQFVQNYRALHGTSTSSSPSRADYSSMTAATPGGASSKSEASHVQNNPFRGFRNTSSLP